MAQKVLQLKMIYKMMSSSLSRLVDRSKTRIKAQLVPLLQEKPLKLINKRGS